MQVNVISNFALFTYYSLSLSNSKSLYYYYYYYYFIILDPRQIYELSCVTSCIENV